MRQPRHSMAPCSLHAYRTCPKDGTVDRVDRFDRSYWSLWSLNIKKKQHSRMYIRTNPTIAHACLCTVWSEGTECNQQVSDKQMPPTSDVGSQMQPPQHIHGVRFGKVPGFLPLLFSGQIVVVVVSFVTPTPGNVKKEGWCPGGTTGNREQKNKRESWKRQKTTI